MDSHLHTVEKFGLSEAEIEAEQNWPSLRLLKNRRAEVMCEILDALDKVDQLALIKERLMQARNPQQQVSPLNTFFQTQWPNLLSQKVTAPDLGKHQAENITRGILAGLESRSARQSLRVKRKEIFAKTTWRRNVITVATEFFWERNELLYRQDLSCTDEIVASGLSIHIGLTVGPTTLQRCQHGDEQSVIDHLIKVISRGNHTLAEIAAHNLHLS